MKKIITYLAMLSFTLTYTQDQEITGARRQLGNFQDNTKTIQSNDQLNSQQRINRYTNLLTKFRERVRPRIEDATFERDVFTQEIVILDNILQAQNEVVEEAKNSGRIPVTKRVGNFMEQESKLNTRINEIRSNEKFNPQQRIDRYNNTLENVQNLQNRFGRFNEQERESEQVKNLIIRTSNDQELLNLLIKEQQNILQQQEVPLLKINQINAKLQKINEQVKQTQSANRVSSKTRMEQFQGQLQDLQKLKKELPITEIKDPIINQMEEINRVETDLKERTIKEQEIIIENLKQYVPENIRP